MNSTGSNNRMLIGILIFLLVAGAAVAFLNMPDRRSGGEKLGDAANALSKGDVGEAGRELGDRTPADRVRDAAHDATR